MYINTSGIVLREVTYKDSSKILTVLTGSDGKLTVSAHGAHRKNSKLAAVTQLLVFSEMTLVSRKDRWTLTEARSVEQFLGLRDDITLLALGAYIAELTEAIADEDCPNPALLPLCLNALYALSEKLKTPGFVKPVFELRLMADSGFAPLVEHCADCGHNDPEHAFVDVAGGTINCIDCGPPEDITLSRGALSAVRYIINCDAKKLFSFTLGDEALRELTVVSEGYLLAHLDRQFRTLDYYKKIISYDHGVTGI